MRSEAFITPDLLRWARERDRLSAEVAARRMNVKLGQLEAWETGDARPTLRQARTLAQKLRIPFGYLFLSQRPTDQLPLPDLRTVGDEAPAEPSAELTDLLNDVLRKQEWYRDYLEQEESEPIPFIGRFSTSDESGTVAADIRNTLGINDEMRRAAGNWEEFLRLFIRRAERVGILVLRSGVVENNPNRKLNVAEFRGFAISDARAPLVFINGQDARAAQIFTLAHEIAHLWIGLSGVSNPDYRRAAPQLGNIAERLCNRVAAETLVPADDFLQRWDQGSPIDANLQTLAARYRVSSIVVLRQALDLGKISQDEYWTSYDQLMERQIQRQRKGEGGDFYATLFARNSSTLTTALITAVAEGRVLHRDAARLLNIKVGTLSGVAERVMRSQVGG